MTYRQLVTGIAVLVAVVAVTAGAHERLSPATSGTVAAPRGAGGLAVRADRLADATVAWWEPRLTDDERLPDPRLGARGDYGTVMLMTASARRAAARANQGALDRALHALAVQAEDPSLGAFELLAFAELRGWAQRRLTPDPRLAGPWLRWRPAIDALLTSRTSVTENPRIRRCFAVASCLSNQKLVGSTAVAALLATGLRAKTGAGLLADPSRRYQDLSGVLELVAGSSIPGVRIRGLRSGEIGSILSDPPSNPTAYHALSTTMLGRLIGEVRARGLVVPQAVIDAYGRAARTLIALTSPDGDLAYLGRGQGQVWVPAVIALASAQIAVDPDLIGIRSDALATADVALRRLERRYRRADGSLTLLPDEPRAAEVGPGGRSTDHYAALRTYNGLAVWALDGTARLLRGRPQAWSPRTARGVVVAPQAGGLVTITGAQHWAAIAVERGRSDDSRYGPGLLALRDRRGRSLVPERPFLRRPAATVALESGPEDLVPSGAVRSLDGDSVLVAGQWRSPQRVLDLRMRWRLTPRGGMRARWRMPIDAGVLVRAVAEQRSLRPLAGGVQDHSARWRVLVNGRVAPSTATVLTAGGSAYAAGTAVVALRAQATAGSVVELRIDPRNAGR